MSVITTYRSFIATLVSGVDFLTGKLGSGYAGVVSLLGDCLAQGTTFAIESRLPGHPNQWRDALAQQGADADLFRYRNESDASWSARVANPWPNYEQAGTPVQLLRAINEWGAIVFPLTWNPALVHLTENNTNGTFVVWLSAGLTPWTTAWKYGDGSRYGVNGLLWGIRNAVPEDIDTLKRIVRKWQRGSSKGKGCIVLSGHVWGEPGLRYGGFNYGGAARVVIGF
jgi:hypothetical protein